MNKKELKKVVKEMNKIIETTTENNASENVFKFLKNTDILMNNLGDIHFFRKKGQFLWFFVKKETEEACLHFLRTIRAIEEEKRRNSNVTNDFEFLKKYENQINVTWLW